MPSSALESKVRVFWRSERSGILEDKLLGEGATPLPSSSCMRGCEMKVCSAGFAWASLSGGLRLMMEFRRVSSVFSIVGKLDMVMVRDKEASEDAGYLASIAHCHSCP